MIGKEEKDKIKLQFTHKGMAPDYKYRNLRFDIWTKYIKTSVKNLIEISKGLSDPKGRGNNKDVTEKRKLY